ncbi:MAG: MATE family efflux transporter [Erysipelotrichaceae bacterium]
MNLILNRFVGDKAFYQRTFQVALPLALQMLLQSCMSIVDMMMVSSIGMVTAVGNATQIITLHDGITWGMIGGTAMFASQFFGAKQNDNLKKCFVLCLMIGLCNASIWIIIASFFGKDILYFYLSDIEVLQYSMIYLKIILFYLVPYAINNAFMTLYRSTHQTKVTLIFSVSGALMNVILNGLFIFVLNFGIAGAALGTVLSQTTVMILNVTYAIKTKQPFFYGLSIQDFHLHSDFVKPIVSKMLPLILNESMFSLAMTLFVKAYGLLGTTSMDAYYVANQIYNMFLFAVRGYGQAVGILIGTRLGSGRIELAKQESGYQLALAGVMAVIMLVVTIVGSKFMVSLFGYTSGVVFELAVGVVCALSLKVFFRMFNFVMFSTLKAGGDAGILNFLDAGIVYLVGLPIAFSSVMLLKIESIVIVILLCQIEQLVRFILTAKRYRTYIWAKDLTKLIEAH